ncbi:hypothetical protein [Thermogemmatispora aurantia]|uniref:hypothetical protein n=1 Tax=Thermogemmatispora aurantia TaxID=2045279 RepID=UPI0014785995|nr:hypothetical protein [Thermogemmatispora aurantia]
MFRQTDPDLGKFLLRTLTLTICACLLAVSVIGVLANLVPMYAASGPQIPLLQPLDSPTVIASPTEVPTTPPTPTPTPTAQPTTPPPSPTSAPTAQPTKTSTPAPAPTRSASPTAVPAATATATAAATVNPTATAKATATSQATTPPTAAPAMTSGNINNGQQSNDNTAAATRIAQHNNLGFLPVVTGVVLMLLALILVGVLLLRHYIAPEPLPRPRLSSGARPWRRTRSPESLAGDRDLAGNPLPLPLEGSPTSVTFSSSWQPAAASAQQSPLRLGNAMPSSESFAAAPTQMQPATPMPASASSSATTPPPGSTRLSPPPATIAHDLPLVPTGLTVTPGGPSSTQHKQSVLPSGALEDTARRPATPRSTPGGPSSSRLKRNFLFPTTSLMPTTGELPVASNLAFPPHGTSPFNGNFLFPTTSLVPAEGMSLSPETGSGLHDMPPQLSPQPGQPGPSIPGPATGERQTEPGASALPPWLASLTADGSFPTAENRDESNSSNGSQL